MSDNIKFMREAILLAEQGMNLNEGGPFGSVVVLNNAIVGRGNNKVLLTNDPTAHAEIVAIRNASENLGTFQLDECEIYTSCEPCPMCLSAIYWARIKKIYYACTRVDAAKIGFDDDFLYKEIPRQHHERQIPIEQSLQPEAKLVFDKWELKPDKIDY